MTWPVPTPRLALVAVAAALAVFVAPDQGRSSIAGLGIDNRFLAVNALLLLVAAVDGALAPPPGSIGVERRHPRSITLGQVAPLTWVVEGSAGRRRWGSSRRVWLADELAPSLRAPARRVGLDLPRRGTASATVDLRPRRRGRFEPTELVLRTIGPAGLVYKQRRRHLPSTLKVLPPFRSAREAELSLRRARILEVGLRSARGRGGGTEFDSLRELTPDDETRRIDWAATARSQRPIVRTFRAERNQTVLCLIDAGRTMAGRVDGVPRLEFAVDGAMLLAELATGLGDRMGLVAFDQDVTATIEPSNRRSQRAVIGEQLFDLEPALAETSFERAVTHVLSRYRRRSFLVLMTELGAEPVEEFLLPALPLLVRTHLVVVAAVRDPALVEWTTSTTVDEDGGFLRASALAALDRREAVAAQLRGRGVVVVDVEPDRFASALGDAYLDAKAVGRL
ncbi:MAG: DUF58 domain-containing protein [Acidimicrobiales bacterium]